MADSGVSIVYNSDAREWRDHVTEAMKREKPAISSAVRIRLERDEKLLYSTKAHSRVTIIILSPGHLHDFLVNNLEFDYRNVIQDPSRAIIFCCGSDLSELNTLDGNGKPLSNRFFEISKWKTFNTDRVKEMIEEVFKLIQKKNSQTKVKLTKTQVKCEEPTDVTLSFEHEVAKDARVEILLIDPTEEDVVVPAVRLNPYTYIFNTPIHTEGEMTVSVLLNDQEISIDGQSKLNYVSSADRFFGITEIYMDLMTRMTEILTTKISLTELDSTLSQLFDLSNTIPSDAFETLFSSYQYIAKERSSLLFPTLLHFAANYGLQEFCSKLSDLPDANLALSITNVSGQLPEQLAINNSHTQLANFLENFREVELDDIYVQHVRDSVFSDSKDDESDGYLKAKVRHAKTKGYTLMRDLRNRAHIEPVDYTSASEQQREAAKKLGTEVYYAGINIQDGPTNLSNEASNKYPTRRPVPIPGAIPENQPTPSPQNEPPPAIRRKPGVLLPPGVNSGPQNEQRHKSTRGSQHRLPVPTETPIPLYSTPVKNPAASPPPPPAPPATSSQDKLIEILNMFKTGKTDIGQTELLYQEWRMEFKGGHSKSFKEKQEWLQKMKEEVKRAKKETKIKKSKKPQLLQVTHPNEFSRPGEYSHSGVIKSNGVNRISSTSSGYSSGNSNRNSGSGSDSPNKPDPTDSQLSSPPMIPPRLR